MGSGILHVRDVSQGAASIYFLSSLMQCSSQAEIKIDMICSSNPNKKATLIHPFLPVKLPELVKNDSETIFLRPLEKTCVYHPLLCLAVSLYDFRLQIPSSVRLPFIPDYIHPRLPAVIRSLERILHYVIFKIIPPYFYFPFLVSQPSHPCRQFCIALFHDQ
jgi:hypothetical protein